MSGLVDRITGRAKKAAGDLIGDAELRARGEREERKADAKQDLATAQRQADLKADEVARLEHERTRDPSAGKAAAGDPNAGDANAGDPNTGGATSGRSDAGRHTP